MDELRKLPPVTRTVLAGVALVTLPCLLQLVSVYHFVYIKKRVFGQAEIWRLVTPFLYGGKGLPLVFDGFLLFRNMNDMEERHFQRRTADFAWAVILICGGIHAANLYMQSGVLFRPFLIGMTHLWAQTNPTSQVSLFGLINMPAPYFPWALLGIDLVKGGPGFALQGFAGLVAAHAYWFLIEIYPRQNNNNPIPFLSTPDFLVQWLGNAPPAAPGGGGAPSTAGPSFATPFRRGGGNRLGATPGGRGFGGSGTEAPVAPAGGTQGTSARASTNTSSTYRWGAGQRLGEE